MTFNTTSYLAGVGTVVAVLSTGFAGGYFPGESDPYRSSKPIAAPGVRRSRREGTRNEKFRIVTGHGEA